MQEWVKEGIEKIGVPLAGAAAAFALGWARDLTEAARRAREMDEAKKRLDFWIAARTSGAIGVESMADEEILKVIVRVRSAYKEREVDAWDTLDYATYRADLGRWRSWLLLYKMPTRYFLRLRRIYQILALVLGFIGIRTAFDSIRFAILVNLSLMGRAVLVALWLIVFGISCRIILEMRRRIIRGLMELEAGESGSKVA